MPPKSNTLIKVSGVVLDNNNMPLPGASIVLKEEATKGVTTDFNGKFNINAAVGQTLEISFVGYKTQTVTVNSQATNLKIILEEDSISLDTIVLTGFGEESKKEIQTGAIENIDVEIIENSANSSMQEGLQGTVSGVQVISGSGDAGGSPNVRIRGVGSIEAAGFPVYVVDGVILDPQEAAAIPSSEIASISVLKDAAATSLYGTKGANGVILLKTKSGKEGKIQYKLSTQTTFIEPTELGKIRPLNTSEYTQLLQEGLINAGVVTSTAEANNYLDTETNYKRNQYIDWYNEIVRTAISTKTDFSLSGGNRKTKLLISLGHQKREGVIKNNLFTRIYGKLKINSKLTDRLEIMGSVFVSKRDRDRFRDGGVSYNPIRSIHRLRPDLAPFDEFEGESSNPIAIFDEYTNNSKDFNIISSLNIDYTINKAFTWSTLLSNSSRFEEFKEILPADAGVFDPYLTVTSSNETDSRSSIRSLLKYKKTFGDHDFNTFLGTEVINEIDKNHFSRNERVLPDLNFAQGNFPSISSSSNFIQNNVSAFVNAQYDYDNKYLLSSSIRRDGSSRFGSNKRFGTFWSVGAGWNIDKEDFMDSNLLFERLKLRASYGVNGQDRIGTYPSLGLYNDITFGNSLGLLISQVPNQNLKWEVNKPLDIGLDFSMLDYRVSGSIDWYSRKTSDLIIDIPISATNGGDEVKRNVGSILNTGLELSLKLKLINNQDFKWKTVLNYTQNKNEVLDIIGNGGIDQIIFSTSRISTGKPLYTFYMPGYAGVDTQTGEALWYKNETKTETTTNYNQALRFDQGDANPDFYGNLSNYFTYKQFKLSFQLYTVWGGKVYDNAGRYLHSDGFNAINLPTTNVSRNYFENRWQKPGDNARYPKYVYQNLQSGNPNQVSSRFIYDGSYVRLRDLTFSYSLAKKVLEKINVSRVKFYFKGTNLWTYVKDPFLQTDPETGIEGELDQRIPISASYAIGAEIKF